MEIFDQLVQSFNEIFSELSDEELEKAEPVLVDELTRQLTGPQAMSAIQVYFQECDLLGYTLDQYVNDIENGKTTIYNLLVSIKEKYAESPTKCELIDITYSLIEGYFNLIALQLATRENPTIGVQLINSTAKIPTYAHDGDQGADIYIPEDNTIPANARGYMVHTGIKLLIPQGWAISIRPRSGMSKNSPLRISNSPATIDQQYRGEINILFDNLSDEPYEIKAGERIAQMILEKNYRADFKQVDTVEPTTDRGEGGFGSSGN